MSYRRQEPYPVLRDLLMLAVTIGAACTAPMLLGFLVRAFWEAFLAGWRMLG